MTIWATETFFFFFFFCIFSETLPQLAPVTYIQSWCELRVRSGLDICLMLHDEGTMKERFDDSGEDM